MQRTKLGENAGQRKVGLDKPCQTCGQPIYFAYKGPYEGICGKCTDRVKRKPGRRSRTRTVVVRERNGGKSAIVAIVLLAFAAGAAVMYFGHHHVLDVVKGWFGK